jgi:Glycosyltransferase family 92
MLKQLAHDFDPSFVTLRSETFRRAQLPVYAWCAEEHRHRFNWMAFFDIDEFFAIRTGCASSGIATTRHAACTSIRTASE